MLGHVHAAVGGEDLSGRVARDPGAGDAQDGRGQLLGLAVAFVAGLYVLLNLVGARVLRALSLGLL